MIIAPMTTPMANPTHQLRHRSLRCFQVSSFQSFIGAQFGISVFQVDEFCDCFQSAMLIEAFR